MNIIKSIITKVLPRPLVHKIRKKHSIRMIKHIVNKNDWEYKKSVLDVFVKPGDTVLDIGANIGYISMIMAKHVGKNGSVFSMEPMPETYDILTTAINKLGYKNVKAFNVGASSEDIEATFEIPVNNDSIENFYQARVTTNTNSKTRKQKALLRRIDGYIFDIVRKVSLIKIDVEGHELEALKGAERMIKHYKPVIIAEASDKPTDKNSETLKIFDFLKKLEYNVYILDNDKLRQQQPGDNPIDYIYLTDNHIKQL